MYNLILVIYAISGAPAGGTTQVVAEFDSYLSCATSKSDQVRQLEKSGAKILSAGCYKK